VYYHHGKKECDFLVRDKTRIAEAIQVSWSIGNENVRKRELAGLLDATENYGLRKGLILTESMEDEIRTENVRITVKPVWKWLLE
jgi:predicted AAA+ superfamily ATPase